MEYIADSKRDPIQEYFGTMAMPYWVNSLVKQGSENDSAVLFVLLASVLLGELRALRNNIRRTDVAMLFKTTLSFPIIPTLLFHPERRLSTGRVGTRWHRRCTPLVPCTAKYVDSESEIFDSENESFLVKSEPR